MQKLSKTLYLFILTICLSLLGACSSLKFPGVYRIPIQQGNYLEEDMITQLKEGLTKRQVRFIMGTPMIEDTFNADRWDYFYNVKRGDTEISANHFIVYFKDDRLTHWEGDYTPINKQVEKEQDKALKDTERKEKAKF
ncbi:outer membrane protein assembly factor BamE [Agarilytica rhodophyticola]|uniref:outer membrane protein assembly factor BamE n=1 Tax=Agarilytica rhodophyticola TaxID=1737490 RepID=UPI000B341CF0|nr:outer membrane protein assembly factor BamE [Agarilytica rhodophyticola]